MWKLVGITGGLTVLGSAWTNLGIQPPAWIWIELPLYLPVIWGTIQLAERMRGAAAPAGLRAGPGWMHGLRPPLCRGIENLHETRPAKSSDDSGRRLRSVAGRAGVALASAVGGLSLAGLAMGCCVFSAPRYVGPVSDHFDGKRFVNQGGVKSKGFGGVLKWQLNREARPWRAFADAPFGPPPPRRVGPGEMRVTFVNHATTLVQIDGVNLLTDPVWSDRVSPVSWAGPTRVRPPGIRFEDLPPIDAVLISHNHYDHLDLPTIERVGKAFNPRIFAGLGNSLLFHEAGFGNAVDLDWWQSVDLPNGVKLTAVPAQHFSNRGICDQDGTLWVGYVIEGASGYAYFAGDTGYGPHFAQIRERFGAPRLAILPIGAFAPEWFMGPIHVSPEEAVKAHQVLGAHRSVAMHFGTFNLADDGQEEPAEKLIEARERAGVDADRFWVLDFGEGRDVPPGDSTADRREPWGRTIRPGAITGGRTAMTIGSGLGRGGNLAKGVPNGARHVPGHSEPAGRPGHDC